MKQIHTFVSEQARQRSHYAGRHSERPAGVFSTRARVDEQKNFRRTADGLEFYVKFSVNETGQFYLVLIQCHLGRFRLRC